MSRRGGRGTAGTLRRGRGRPKATTRRRVPTVLCWVQCEGSYLVSVDPERRPVLGDDPSKALRMPAPEARQVCLGMRELGYDAEVVPAGRVGR